MADIPFNIAYKELKIAQIAQLNQLFQLFAFSLYIRFYELSRMLMRKNISPKTQISFVKGFHHFLQS